ncbi:hypothetical protein HU200_045184 [Digitaria exilis]|uniref:F-box domain-containing protein n=1 Tax=Digitaria exilis TaxID=1010633 RepID=A0A835EFQ7_9POAL|nr:hypothetical protein HU200_045184 [Digitaria exilis]
MGPLARLPDDVFADILRRVPPRGLAACRCVSEAWRAFVDGRRLLRANLLPLSVGGIFINFNNYYISELFSCPASTTAGAGSMISGKHDYLPDPESLSWKQVRDHCNGLVLIRGYGADDIWYVLNPATRWVDSFHSPPPAMGKMDTYEDMYLVYDPAVSPDYDVVSVSRHMHRSDYSCDIDNDIEQSEWPPSVCILQVFSSRTRQWEERSFAREGRAIGTVADMRDWHKQRNAVYWRGALYIHCQTDFVMRISLESDKYHVIEPPTGIEVLNFFPQIYLGKSAKGVYCASINNGRWKVRVWNLVESGATMEWVLKHDKDLLKWLLKNKLQYSRPFKNYGPWTLQDINYYDYDESDEDDNMEALVDEELEWRSQASSDGKSAWSTDDA